MVNAVVVPEWLKRMPMAPEFYPTETEFADPIAYISKIEKEAAAFGICKIIPPIPKPSKKHVFANLNKALSKRPDLGSDVNFCATNLGSSKSSGGENSSEGIRAVFTTRQQELGHCKKKKGVGNEPHYAAQKQVWQSGVFYTLEQFEAKAKAFSRDRLGKIEDVSPLVVETLFWKAASEKPIYVEYANDVPGSGFSEPTGQAHRSQGHKSRRRVFTQNKCVRSDEGSMIVNANNPKVDEQVSPSMWNGPNATSESGKISSGSLTELPDEEFKMSGQKGLFHNHGAERTASWKLSNSPWNLQVISRSAGSLTRFMLDDIPGVTSPMVYIGMLFSWFAWHVEDHELHSLNFLHAGSPKTWYAVPGEHAYTFEEIVHKEAYADIVDTLAALTILGEKTTLVSPEVVARGGIPCCRLVQNPGEFVVTFPRAYHIGFSHGFNCGEAANFGTPQWLSVAKEAAVRRTIMDHLPMLSHQQLLYLLTMSFISRIPVSLLPGVRSSRLRNRQKEARELSVKKAFIEDVLESNKLVIDLFRRDSSFRAVFWNSNSLSTFAGESVSQSGISVGATSQKNDMPDICLKDDNDQINLHDQITLHKQSMDDFDIFDLSGDFEISSGALPCVACGILGFPYMCVVQPSRKASTQILPAGGIPDLFDPVASQAGKQGAINISKPSVSAMAYEFNERWDASCRFLRPRIFCLEHAVQTEELLRPKGGVNVLLICHSDFQKIKPTAAVIAEEMGFTFGFKEVSPESASPQDLNLINLAIDDEPNSCSEDWTSSLCINLKHAVKVRKNSPLMPMKHKFKLCGFPPFAVPVLDISTLKWSRRRSRTKGMQRCDNPSDSISVKDETVSTKDDVRSTNTRHIEIDNVSTENSDGRLHGKTDVHIQYSRRYRSKSSKLVEARDASKNIGKPSAETSVGHAPTKVSNCGKEMLRAMTEGSASSTLCWPKAQLNVMINAQASEVSEASDADNSCLSAIGGKLPEDVNDSKICGLNGTAHEEDVVRDNILDGSHKDGVSLHSDLVNTDPENLSSSAAALFNRQSEEVDAAVLETETTSRKQKRGVREVTLLGFKFDQGGFIKSPCEGLRPRTRKEESNANVAEDPPSKKKKPSEIPASGNGENSVEAPVGTYRCNIDQCQMHFKTRAELSRHKQNRCALEGCGKRFNSHMKAVVHQKVHDEDLLYKCTWTGCKMAFSTELLKTEHMQTHSGCRAYQCCFEGCGLTFRYASQLKRHKRRTGHAA